MPITGLGRLPALILYIIFIAKPKYILIFSPFYGLGNRLEETKYHLSHLTSYGELPYKKRAPMHASTRAAVPCSESQGLNKCD